MAHVSENSPVPVFPLSANDRFRIGWHVNTILAPGFTQYHHLPSAMSVDLAKAVGHPTDDQPVWPSANEKLGGKAHTFHI